MNWNQALFPSLKTRQAASRLISSKELRETIPSSLGRRGGCAIKKISRSNLSSRRRGGHIGEILRLMSFAELTTPSAALRRLRNFLLMPPTPLLFKEGNVSALKQSATLVGLSRGCRG